MQRNRYREGKKMKRRRISACGTVLPLAAAMFTGCTLGCRIQMDTHYLLTGLILVGLYAAYILCSRQGRHPGTYPVCLVCFLLFGMELVGSQPEKEPRTAAQSPVTTAAASMNRVVCERIDTLSFRYSLNERLAIQTSASLKALLMGNKSGISKETAGRFKLSGTIHLLALSGLHVGIIYLFVSLFFIGIPAYGNWRILKSILILLSIWGFALITGLSISTIRASIFVTIREISRLFHRSPSSGDVLGTTAILMLSSRPGYALDLGFQMSFAAVAGIVLLVTPVNRFYKDTTADLLHRIQLTESHGKTYRKTVSALIRLTYRLVSNLTITAICQLTSGSIALYHFRVYPRFFLLANLLAIPAATVSVFTGMILLILGGIPPIGKIACVTLNLSIFVLENVAEIFA